MDKPSIQNNYLANHVKLLADSYFRLLQKPLMPGSDAQEYLAQQIYYAPFVLLSHTNAADPLFNYGNAAALTLFELDWETLIQTPSRLSAEAVNREERRHLLQQVNQNGFIDNYQGIRISSSGKRFQISHAVVWNVTSKTGAFNGQAACFDCWEYIDD